MSARSDFSASRSPFVSTLKQPKYERVSTLKPRALRREQNFHRGSGLLSGSMALSIGPQTGSRRCCHSSSSFPSTYMREPLSPTTASASGRNGSRSRTVDLRAPVTIKKRTPAFLSCATSSTVLSETTPSPIVVLGSSRQRRDSPCALVTMALCFSWSASDMETPCFSNQIGKWMRVPSRSEKMARITGLSMSAASLERCLDLWMRREAGPGGVADMRLGQKRAARRSGLDRIQNGMAISSRKWTLQRSSWS
mmetsp:Transcript_49994/g.108344  ORF Transcript_49994/g.108344 Transcript_49994/m.108344 type:complete len:252 (-) Transcript_49994:301-1056(-)